jgi:hypothetical protein
MIIHRSGPHVKPAGNGSAANAGDPPADKRHRARADRRPRRQPPADRPATTPAHRDAAPRNVRAQPQPPPRRTCLRPHVRMPAPTRPAARQMVATRRSRAPPPRPITPNPGRRSVGAPQRSGACCASGPKQTGRELAQLSCEWARASARRAGVRFSFRAIRSARHPHRHDRFRRNRSPRPLAREVSREQRSDHAGRGGRQRDRRAARSATSPPVAARPADDRRIHIHRL